MNSSRESSWDLPKLAVKGFPSPGGGRRCGLAPHLLTDACRAWKHSGARDTKTPACKDRAAPGAEPRASGTPGQPAQGTP